MKLADTHTHLYVEQFDDDRHEVVTRAIRNGIEQLFVPAIDASYYPAMFELKKSFPGNIHLMAGLHPTHVKPGFENELQVVKKMLDTGDFCAVGEIGIDLYWDKQYLKLQQEAFYKQIEWAKEKKLPVVIHCRDAFDEIFEVLKTVNDDDLYGIFHCFTGTKAQAEEAVSYGMKLGIGGVVTFKNGKIDRFLNEIDLKHIVLETDSPYLAPVPYRGKRNESAYLTLIAEKLSVIYGLPVEKIAEITTQNALEVFGI